MKHLWVVGPALRGSGYPNAQQTIEILKLTGDWTVHDHADWLPLDTHLWRIAQGAPLQRLGLALRLGLSGYVGAVRSVLLARRRAWVYVPYPAPMTLWWLSLVPQRWRPRCIADTYISIWDSMFRDRSDGGVQGLLSRLIWRFERRGLRAAYRVLVDTQANRHQVIDDYGLDEAKVVSVPLAIDEKPFLAVPPRPPAVMQPLRVLFVGTLVPLHGIEFILRAIEVLAEDSRFDFRLIGDGQKGNAVEHFLARAKPRNLTWIRQWIGLDRMASEIADADICLGVFGGGEKAARVLPFKLYMYLAAGRPIITQEHMSVPAGAPRAPVDGTTADHRTLVESLLTLAGNESLRMQRGGESREYYECWLANARVVARWRQLVR